jgi:hypothetical protein
MSTQITFLDCPAYIDTHGKVRCGLPAAVTCRYIMNSTDGPLESAMIRCPGGHFFNGSIESLAYEKRVRTKDKEIRLDTAGTRLGEHTLEEGT